MAFNDEKLKKALVQGIITEEIYNKLIEFDPDDNKVETADVSGMSRFSKLNVVKNIMEDLELDSLAKETNKDGQTPYSIAESVDNKAICDYLRNNTENQEGSHLQAKERSLRRNQLRRHLDLKNSSLQSY